MQMKVCDSHEDTSHLSGDSRDILEFQARLEVYREDGGLSATGLADGRGVAAGAMVEAAGRYEYRAP